MFHITGLVFLWAGHLTKKVGLAEQPTYHKKHKVKRNVDPGIPSESEREKGTTSYRQLNSIHIMNLRVLLEEQGELYLMAGYRWLLKFMKEGRGYVVVGVEHPGMVIPLWAINWISSSSLLQVTSEGWLCRSMTSGRVFSCI